MMPDPEAPLPTRKQSCAPVALVEPPPPRRFAAAWGTRRPAPAGYPDVTPQAAAAAAAEVAGG